MHNFLYFFNKNPSVNTNVDKRKYNKHNYYQLIFVQVKLHANENCIQILILFLNQGICFGYSKEPSETDLSTQNKCFIDG